MTVLSWLFIFFTAYLPVNKESVTQARFISKKQALYLDNFQIQPGCTISDIQQVWGEREPVQEYPSGKKIYIYEELGLAFHTRNDNVIVVGFTYHPDGDRNYASRAFRGQLSIDELPITLETRQPDLETLDHYHFVCAGPLLCAAPPNQKAPVRCVVGFESSQRQGITQISFFIDSEENQMLN